MQYEHKQGKFWPITNGVCVLLAGIQTFQTEIMQDVEAIFSERIKNEPETIAIKELAATYSQCYINARQRRMEREILGRYGLSHEAFLAKQKDLDQFFVESIHREMRAFEAPLVESLFTGVDELGPHIYHSYGMTVDCYDSVGFAAIGSGAAIARSQFEHHGHSRWVEFPMGLLLTYSAKRRAEAAPGVGVSTDMLILGPTRGQYYWLAERDFKGLEKIYSDRLRRDRKSATSDEQKMRKFLASLATNAEIDAPQVDPEMGLLEADTTIRQS